MTSVEYEQMDTKTKILFVNWMSSRVNEWIPSRPPGITLPGYWVLRPWWCEVWWWKGERGRWQSSFVFSFYNSWRQINTAHKINNGVSRLWSNRDWNKIIFGLNELWIKRVYPSRYSGVDNVVVSVKRYSHSRQWQRSAEFHWHRQIDRQSDLARPSAFAAFCRPGMTGMSAIW